MYKVVIVDEEMIYKKVFENVIDWSLYGFEICEQIYDVQEAYDLISKITPDIVIITFNLLNKAGLDLAHKLKMENIDTQTIIISECNELEYIQKAMDCGVRKYLLMPVDNNNMLINFGKIKNELILSLKEIGKELNSTIKADKFIVKDNMLRKILLDLIDYRDIKKQIKQYGFDYDYDVFNVAIIPISKYYEKKEKQRMHKEIEYFLSNLKNVDYIVLERRIVIILKGLKTEQAKQKLKICNDYMYEKYKKRFLVCLGQDVKYIKDLSFSYESAGLLEKYRFIYAKEEILTMDIFSNISRCDISKFDFSKISMYIEASNTKMILNELKVLKDCFIRSNLDESTIKIRIMHNIVLIQNNLEDKYFEYEKKFLDMDMILKKINTTTNIEELFDTLYEYCINTSKALVNLAKTSVVKRICLFMEKNYNTDLKLEKIAKIFNYNKAYLGKLIKQETGKNYNALLDIIRLEKAKELLIETNLKVYQISDKIGYCTLDYFYIKFKKYTGISPTEYRVLNRN